MGFLTVGLNLIRDLCNTLMSHIECGTGTTTETREDTDLETPVSGSETDHVTATTTSQQLVKTGTFLSTFDRGNVSEVIWKKDSPELAHSRITCDAITENSTHEEADLIVETRWFYKGVNE